MTVLELIQKRRTVRKFSQKPLTTEQLTRWVDAARMAPSGANLQPLKYAAVCDPETVKNIFPLLKWAGYLAPEYDPKPGERPTAYIVVCADTFIRKTGFEADAGAAVENLILAALEEGVGACWIGSVDRPALKALLQLPEGLVITHVVALGYPAEDPEAVTAEDGNIRYYLEDETLRVPKRPLEEVLIAVR